MLRCVSSYLKETPYCATLSKPDFQTRVTSHALVAESRHERKAEMAFPPTIRTSLVICRISIEACEAQGDVEGVDEEAQENWLD